MTGGILPGFKDTSLTTVTYSGGEERVPRAQGCPPRLRRRRCRFLRRRGLGRSLHGPGTDPPEGLLRRFVARGADGMGGDPVEWVDVDLEDGPGGERLIPHGELVCPVKSG